MDGATEWMRQTSWIKAYFWFGVCFSSHSQPQYRTSRRVDRFVPEHVQRESREPFGKSRRPTQRPWQPLPREELVPLCKLSASPSLNELSFYLRFFLTAFSPLFNHRRAFIPFFAAAISAFEPFGYGLRFGVLLSIH